MSIQIRGEPSADGTLCRFVVDREIYARGSYLCSSSGAARGNSLLEALFRVEGVTQVWIAGSTVTLQKVGGTPWPEAGKQAGAAIRAFLEAGFKFVPPPRPASAASGDLAARVRDILDKQINPGVAGHGGKIELIDIEGGSVRVRMSGGCQGCGSAQMTLRQGVEKHLRAQLPEITGVVDVTDHSAGSNPFYR